MDRLNVSTIQQTIAAATRWNIAGAYLRLIEFTGSGSVDIEFFRGGVSVGIAKGFLPGLAVEEFQFDSFVVTPAAAGSVTIIVADAPVKYDRFSGSVLVTNTAGAHVNSRASVTSAAVSTLKAANAARRFLLVQNNDASIALRVTCDGVDPTIAQGIRIAAGGSLLLDAFPPTGAIKAIAESGAGIAIEVQEG